MATSFGFFLDPGLTTPVLSALQFVQTAVAPSPADTVVYFGSRAAASNCVPAGGGNIVVSIAGPGAANMRLALSSAGLAAATPGASLALGSTVASGTAGAIAVHLRALDTSGTTGARAVSFSTNSLEEWA